MPYKCRPKNPTKPVLDPALSKVRTCLMCGDLFNSTWAGERVCRACRATKAWRDGGGLEAGRGGNGRVARKAGLS